MLFHKQNNVISSPFNYIDEEMNDYFSKIESDIIYKIYNTNGIKYFADKKYITELIDKEEFDNFISSLYENLNILINDSVKGSILEHVDYKHINFKLNTTLINEYKNTSLISKSCEYVFDELLEDSLDMFLYAKICNVEFSEILLSTIGLSDFSNIKLKSKHNDELVKRIKGNLLNIKYRIIKINKQQVSDYIYLKNIGQEKTA